MLVEGLGNSVDFLEEIEAMVLRTILGYRLAFIPSFLDLCPPPAPLWGELISHVRLDVAPGESS